MPDALIPILLERERETIRISQLLMNARARASQICIRLRQTGGGGLDFLTVEMAPAGDRVRAPRRAAIGTSRDLMGRSCTRGDARCAEPSMGSLAYV